MKTIFKSLFNLFLSVCQTLFGGAVFSLLWNWFIVRKFPTLPRLSYLDAVGILIVLAFPLLSLHVADAKRQFKETHGDMSDTSRDILFSLLMMALVYPIIMLAAFLWKLAIG